MYFDRKFIDKCSIVGHVSSLKIEKFNRLNTGLIIFSPRVEVEDSFYMA